MRAYNISYIRVLEKRTPPSVSLARLLFIVPTEANLSVLLIRRNDVAKIFVRRRKYHNAHSFLGDETRYKNIYLIGGSYETCSSPRFISAHSHPNAIQNITAIM
jgi:hypothetical protein